MGKLIRLIKGSKKGQGLLEYSIIIPTAILVVMAATWALGVNTGDIYRHLASVIMGQKECVPQYDFEDNSICDDHEFCEKAEYDDAGSGSYTYDGALSIDSLVIKAGRTYEIRRDNPFQYVYTTSDGCYTVTFKTNKVSWERTGNGPDCQNVSHIDHWQAPICTPE
jgi:hypothetical protein